jgi:hypothetical protein
MYYLHRPVVSLELAPGLEFGDARDLLAKHLGAVDVVLVGAENLRLIQPLVSEEFVRRAEVQVDGRESLVILTRDGSGGRAEVLDAADGARAYDEAHAAPEDVVQLPLRAIVQWQRELDAR